MIDIYYSGTVQGLMEYLDTLVLEDRLKDNHWTDRPDYNSDGEPNE